jgi:outer membrane protein assembly factor BamB
VADSTIYAGSYDREGQTGTVHALSVENGSERWRTTGIEINKSGLAVDETTVYASGKQHVYALSREDGRERWRTKVDGLVGQGDDEPNHLESAPAVANGTCYVGTKDGRLRALSTENGNELWSANVCESIISSPAVDESKVYVSGWLGTVVAVSRSNGNTQWSREITGTLFGSPAIVDSTLFVPSVTGGLHAFATDDGTKRWQFNTTNALMGPPAVADGTVYVVDENGRLLALSHSESDGLFGIGLLDDPLPIGVGAGIAGMAIATMYKLYKDVTGNQSENDDTDRH